MKKSAIAVAVAAVLAAPVALAEVSISGGLQAELRSVDGDGGMRDGLYATDGGEYTSENGGSYGFIKFSASEDLGDGLKAIAMWNGAVNVGDSNAAGGMAGRDSYVGLSGGFGTVLAGTLSTPYKSSTVGWDPLVMTSLQARGNGGMSDLHNGYASNAIAYAGTFGAAKVVAAIVLDEGNDPTNATDTNGEHAMSFSVNAPVGPVELAVAHVAADKFSDVNNLGLGATATLVGASTFNDLSATKVGVKWVSGDLTVAGQYEMLTINTIDPTVVNVNVSYKMGNNILVASVGQTDWDVANTDETTYMAVAVKHAFSKNTTGWVGYRSTDVGNLYAPAPDQDETSLSAGLRVAF